MKKMSKLPSPLLVTRFQRGDGHGSGHGDRGDHDNCDHVGDHVGDHGGDHGVHEILLGESVN